MLLALAGCLYISDKDHEARLAAFGHDDTGTPTVAGAPRLDRVWPPYGTDAGGTELTLSGADFVEPIEVYVGTGRATVVSVTAETVVIETPPSATTGAVEVTVATDAGSDRLDDAYTYWPDATGLASATGELVWFEVVGDYWGEGGPGDYGRATLRFTQGWDFRFYYYWAPTLDTCTRITNGVKEYEYEPVYDNIDARGGTATLRADSTAIDLPYNSTEGRFLAYDISAAQYAAGESYDLALSDTPGLPELEIADAFTAPARFELEEPLLDVPEPLPLTADQHFGWNTDETGDAVIIQVGMLNVAGDAFEEELYCVSRDVGSFTLPEEMWTRWARDRYVNVLVGRYRTGNELVPWNQGRMEVAAQFWWYGAGISR